MFKALVIFAIVGLAVAHPGGPSGDDVHSEVTLLKNDVRADGFDAAWDLSNHIGETRTGDEHGNIKGTVNWISPEGEHIELSYVADEHGYQPTGSHLPTPPPIPEQIARALAWLEAHPSKEH